MKWLAGLLCCIAVSGCGASSTSAPTACTDAIKQAELYIQRSADAYELAGGYVPLIQEAAEAGLSNDDSAMQSVGRKIKARNQRLDKLRPKLESRVNAFRTAAADCK